MSGFSTHYCYERNVKKTNQKETNRENKREVKENRQKKGNEVEG